VRLDFDREAALKALRLATFEKRGLAGGSASSTGPPNPGETQMNVPLMGGGALGGSNSTHMQMLRQAAAQQRQATNIPKSLGTGMSKVMGQNIASSSRKSKAGLPVVAKAAKELSVKKEVTASVMEKEAVVGKLLRLGAQHLPGLTKKHLLSRFLSRAKPEDVKRLANVAIKRRKDGMVWNKPKEFIGAEVGGKAVPWGAFERSWGPSVRYGKKVRGSKPQRAIARQAEKELLRREARSLTPPRGLTNVRLKPPRQKYVGGRLRHPTKKKLKMPGFKKMLREGVLAPEASRLGGLLGPKAPKKVIESLTPETPLKDAVKGVLSPNKMKKYEDLMSKSPEELASLSGPAGPAGPAGLRNWLKDVLENARKKLPGAAAAPDAAGTVAKTRWQKMHGKGDPRWKKILKRSTIGGIGTTAAATEASRRFAPSQLEYAPNAAGGVKLDPKGAPVLRPRSDSSGKPIEASMGTHFKRALPFGAQGALFGASAGMRWPYAMAADAIGAPHLATWGPTVGLVGRPGGPQLGKAPTGGEQASYLMSRVNPFAERQSTRLQRKLTGDDTINETRKEWQDKRYKFLMKLRKERLEREGRQ